MPAVLVQLERQGGHPGIRGGAIPYRGPTCSATGRIHATVPRYEAARRGRTTRMVLASAENAKRFHNPELAAPVCAQAYVDREWAEERVRERYEWLFCYEVDTVSI